MNNMQPYETSEAPAATPSLASRWKRLGGALIDGFISMIIVLPFMFATGIIAQLSQGNPLTIGQQIFFFLVGFAIFILVHGYLLAKHGQTVGKRLVGTRIVSVETNRILPLSRILGLRYLPVALAGQLPYAGAFISLADILFIFRKDKRCIHDLIAGTKVVDAQAAAIPNTVQATAVEDTDNRA